MISLLVRNSARALSAVRAVGVTTVQRTLFTNPFKAVGLCIEIDSRRQR